MSLMLAALSTLAMAAAPVQASSAAKDPVNRADLQCLAVISAYAGELSQDDPAQAGLTGGVMYYLGRLEGRVPQEKWLDRLSDMLFDEDEMNALDGERGRCGQEMEAKGGELQTWGQAIQERAGS